MLKVTSNVRAQRNVVDRFGIDSDDDEDVIPHPVEDILQFTGRGAPVPSTYSVSIYMVNREEYVSPNTPIDIGWFEYFMVMAHILPYNNPLSLTSIQRNRDNSFINTKQPR